MTDTRRRNRATPTPPYALGKRALTFAVASVLTWGALTVPAAHAVGSLANVEIIARGDARPLPAVWGQDRYWVVGTPRQDYAIRVCNMTAGRLLAVTSVDGVNVVTGDTAAPDQGGYVLDAHSCHDIAGWRKSLSRIAAFYFTELPDSYAARTGRPDNLGVIGVAVFREKVAPTTWRPLGKFSAESRHDGGAGAPPPAPAAADSGRAREEAAPAAARTLQSQLGTGHGRSEVSQVTQVSFERESATPAETIAIHYDRRENLVAMGVLPPPIAQVRPANPFPGWPQFVADPPRR
jgi:hypothetical protein